MTEKEPSGLGGVIQGGKKKDVWAFGKKTSARRPQEHLNGEKIRRNRGGGQSEKQNTNSLSDWGKKGKKK